MLTLQPILRWKHVKSEGPGFSYLLIQNVNPGLDSTPSLLQGVMSQIIRRVVDRHQIFVI
jgi:hypothetical protein